MAPDLRISDLNRTPHIVHRAAHHLLAARAETRAASRQQRERPFAPQPKPLRVQDVPDRHRQSPRRNADPPHAPPANLVASSAPKRRECFAARDDRPHEPAPKRRFILRPPTTCDPHHAETRCLPPAAALPSCRCRNTRSLTELHDVPCLLGSPPKQLPSSARTALAMPGRSERKRPKHLAENAACLPGFTTEAVGPQRQTKQ